MGLESYKYSEKYEEEMLSEGMIANAKLLANDKYEYDNLIGLFGDRLRIIPNGSSRIGKKIKLKSFSDRFIHRVFSWPINYKDYREDFKDSIYELSNVTTSLFSYSSNEKDYIGLAQVIHNKENTYVIGKALNHMINTTYSLLAFYTKYNLEMVTPNDIIYRDMRANMEEDLSLYDIDLKTFNLVRLLIVVSDNLPQINYNRVINSKKSPINSRRYNDGGDNVVLNDLLYAGKYGKAAVQYSKIFNSYLGHENAFENLLCQYDYVLDATRKGQNLDKKVIKEIINTIYLYYGAKFIKMQSNNAMDNYSLNMYKEKVMKAFNVAIDQYELDFSLEDLKSKYYCEKAIELYCTINKDYYKLSRVKESFEPHEKVPMDADNKARELKLKYNLRN